MKKITIMLSLILLFPTFAFGKQIFGSLKEGNTAVGEGVGIRIKCGDNEHTGQTDVYGSYSVFVPNPGRCAFQVYYGGVWSQPYDIYSDETDPVRYDFELVRESDGTFVLKRR